MRYKSLSPVLNDLEYLFLKGYCPDGVSTEDYLEVGAKCHDKGYIDVFGFVTDTGKDAMRQYKEKNRITDD